MHLGRSRLHYSQADGTVCAFLFMGLERWWTYPLEHARGLVDGPDDGDDHAHHPQRLGDDLVPVVLHTGGDERHQRRQVRVQHLLFNQCKGVRRRGSQGGWVGR